MLVLYCLWVTKYECNSPAGADIIVALNVTGIEANFNSQSRGF